jgi:glycosyltransferase involved in cell wall biosynthesis
VKLSVLIPVYNEANTIEEILRRVLAVDMEKEVIIVDDGSTDGTREFLRSFKDPRSRILFHEKNSGKGAAIQTALAHAEGDVVIIQDADLEYDPGEYGLLTSLIEEGKADVVYGSRFLGRHRVFMYSHFLGNRILTTITNILYNTFLTDMETCYKAMKIEVARGLNIRSNRFNVEPEITAKIFKKKWRVYEVPISYDGRGYGEGKKITWRDGVVALWTLIRYRFVD